MKPNKSLLELQEHGQSGVIKIKQKVEELKVQKLKAAGTKRPMEDIHELWGELKTLNLLLKLLDHDGMKYEH